MLQHLGIGLLVPWYRERERERVLDSMCSWSVPIAHSWSKGLMEKGGRCIKESASWFRRVFCLARNSAYLTRATLQVWHLPKTSVGKQCYHAVVLQPRGQTCHECNGIGIHDSTIFTTLEGTLRPLCISHLAVCPGGCNGLLPPGAYDDGHPLCRGH